MNFIRLVPKPLRQAIYDKLLAQMRRIDARDVAVFSREVLRIARQILSL